MRIVILRSAIDDLIQGQAFYERQGEGLGDYFEESLSADIDSLRLFAGIHALVHGYHRMLSAKFPFAVYYDVVGDQIRVRAVLDCRRDPKRTRNRLRD
ncbi:MAG: hypothetical protein BWX54_01320 [Verrucomicrobia bacterium ADurb.Bin018]|nr:MAG: hypothetical protein BWX54_01320 [Verrucomicrobia bacterium ADurb.Bin018]